MRTTSWRDWPDTKLRTSLLAYITKRCMKQDQWRFTRLDGLHEELRVRMALAENEQPVVSSFISAERWYALTTRRILGQTSERRVELWAYEIESYASGNFKGYELSPAGLLRPQLGTQGTERMTFRFRSGEEAAIEYETGYASMAPIYYVRFWTLKFPALFRDVAVPSVEEGADAEGQDGR